MPALRNSLVALSLSCAALSFGCGGTNKSSPDMTMTSGPDMTMTTGPDLTMTNGPDMTMHMSMTVNVMVGMGGNVFDPKNVTITQGDTIHWIWAGNGSHNVVSGTDQANPDNKFCSDPTMATDCKTSKTFAAPHTYDFKFMQAGTFDYFCRPHFGAGMKGTITVNPQ